MTVCDVAGIPVPTTVRGRSLMPVLTGRTKSIRPEVFGYFGDVQRMVRTDRWKLIWYPKINREQQVELRTDPHELHDLVSNPRMASTESSLRDRLKAWLKEEGDPLLA